MARILEALKGRRVNLNKYRNISYYFDGNLVDRGKLDVVKLKKSGLEFKIEGKKHFVGLKKHNKELYKWIHNQGLTMLLAGDERGAADLITSYRSIRFDLVSKHLTLREIEQKRAQRLSILDSVRIYDDQGVENLFVGEPESIKFLTKPLLQEGEVGRVYDIDCKL